MSERRLHRCSSCGHRWESDLKGAELCGDCWRTAQPVLHGVAGAHVVVDRLDVSACVFLLQQAVTDAHSEPGHMCGDDCRAAVAIIGRLRHTLGLEGGVAVAAPLVSPSTHEEHKEQLSRVETGATPPSTGSTAHTATGDK